MLQWEMPMELKPGMEGVTEYKRAAEEKAAEKKKAAAPKPPKKSVRRRSAVPAMCIA